MSGVSLFEVSARAGWPLMHLQPRFREAASSSLTAGDADVEENREAAMKVHKSLSGGGLSRGATMTRQQSLEDSPGGWRGNLFRTRRRKHTHTEDSCKGQIRIKVIGAENLRALEKSIFRLPSSNPYAVINLRHEGGKQSRSRRTNQQKRTTCPKWKATFEFSVKEPPSEITLSADIFHQATREGVAGAFMGQGHGDQFLGHAEVLLSEIFSRKEPFRIANPIKELTLEVSDEYPDVTSVIGSIKLEIGWQPMYYGKGRLKNTREMFIDAFYSPQAIRVVHAACLGGAGTLLLVATSCRWLCKGGELSDCEEVPVSGASTCTLFAGLAANLVMLFHFLGTAGLFGPSWHRRPLKLLDLLEKDADPEDEDEEFEPDDHDEEGGGGSLKVRLKWGAPTPEGIDTHVSIVPKICGKMCVAACITWVRVFSMLLHLIALTLCGLAIWLAFMRMDGSTIGGEAYILDVASLFLLLLGFCFSMRERRLMHRLEQEKWMHISDEPKQMKSSLTNRGETFAAAKALEAWNHASAQAEALTQQAEMLTEPLLRKANEMPEKFRVHVKENIENRYKETMDKFHEDVQNIFHERLGAEGAGNKRLSHFLSHAGISPNSRERVMPSPSVADTQDTMEYHDHSPASSSKDRRVKKGPPTSSQRRQKTSSEFDGPPINLGSFTRHRQPGSHSFDESRQEEPSIEDTARPHGGLMCFTCQ